MRSTVLVAAVSLLAGAVPAAPSTARDFGFRPLEIYTFQHGTRQLTVRDINGDGLDDVLFINNHESRLEILLRRKEVEADGDLPSLEDAFVERGMIVDQQLSAYRLSDVDGDKRLDLVEFGLPLGLQLRRQNGDGAFGAPHRLYVKSKKDVVTVQADDLDADGWPDIVVCRRSGAEILWNDRAGAFRRRKPITFAGDNGAWAEIVDINADGHLDLLFFFSGAQAPLRVRLGDGRGGYGLEHVLELPPMRHVRLIEQGGDTRPRLGCVLRDGLGFRLYDYATLTEPPLLESDEVVPRRIAFEGLTRKETPPWTVHDVNGDGYDDFVVAAPELSRLHVYHGEADGIRAEPEALDTLSHVSGISATSAGDLLVVSRKEKATALHRQGAQTGFPPLLRTPGEAIVADVRPADNAICAVCRTEDGNYVLAVGAGAGAEMTTTPLEVRNDPDAMRVFGLGNDTTGVLLFVPYAPPVMYRLSGSDAAKVEPADFRALSDTLAARQVCIPDRADGRRLLVSQGRTTRLFTWADGSYSVTRQLSPRNEQADIVAACPYRGRKGDAGTLLYDQHGHDLIWYPDENGRDAVSVHVKNGPSELSGLAQLHNPERDVLVLVGRNELCVLVGAAPRLALASRGEYMSPSDDPSLTFVKAVKVGRPPRPMLSLVDTANRALELVAETDAGLEQALAFETFLDSGFGGEDAEHMREPHDVESGDIDGDGAGDLAVLVHDKLLLYLGD